MTTFNPKLKRYQKKFDFSYTFGAYPTIDLLKYKKEYVAKVILKEEGMNSDGVDEVVNMCKEWNIKVEVNSRLVDRISFKENTYVVGVFQKYKSSLNPESNHVLLVNPSDMGNMGTTIRSMLGFSFHDLGIIKPSVDIFAPKVIRSTMGAFFKLRFEFFDTVDEYMGKYSKHFRYPFMLNGKKCITDVEFKEPFVLMHGNEGKGLPDSFGDIGESVYIPHSKDIDSLNLSVATSLGLWEVYKKKV